MSNTLISENISVESQDTGVAWPAILGGTVAASAFLLLLAPLGASLGLSMSSPWHDWDSAEKTFTVIGAAWLIIVQWLSSGVGGYLTGRLRTAWPGAHTHEVFFRDTAHGFLTWALTSVVAVLLIAGGLSHGDGRHLDMDPMHTGIPGQTHAVGKLFRMPQGGSSPSVTEQDRADSIFILNETTKEKGISESDEAYLTQLVSARTGLSETVAQARVNSVVAEVDETAKITHRNKMVAGLFLFLSMWIGAFIASAAGALGGMHRDTHYRTGRLS